MFPLSTDINGNPHETPTELQRLLEIAHRGTGQSRVVARFLLSLYNGDRFPFDLTDFRCLDADFFKDCLRVLMLDNFPRREVHAYFKNGNRIWESMAAYWRFTDHDSESWR